MIIFRSALLLVVVIFSISACKTAEVKTGNKKETAQGKEKTDKHVGCENVHWKHAKGEEGPETWKDLCDDYKACGGKVQSPIDIVSKDAKPGEKLSAFKFAYTSTDTNIVNNGHTVQFNVSGDNKVTIGDKEYKLLQFHYHAKSEHTVDGKQFPLEVHFVHKHSDTDFAVLGMVFNEGKENALFAKYLKSFPTEKGEHKGEDKIDLIGLFPKDKSYYHYSGSLTTPPCSEVVSWYVLKTPLTASKDQLEAFSKILHNNFRPVMPLNGRDVTAFAQK